MCLALKAPIKICSGRHSKIFFFFFYFSEKTSLDISCESSAKYQDLFSSENKKIKIVVCFSCDLRFKG